MFLPLELLITYSKSGGKPHQNISNSLDDAQGTEKRTVPGEKDDKESKYTYAEMIGLPCLSSCNFQKT